VLIGSTVSAWSYLGYVSLVASGFFVIFGARASLARSALNDSVVALQGRLSADQDEIRGLRETNEKQQLLLVSNEQQIADLRAQMHTLEGVVTGRAELAHLATVARVGFIALGVDPTKLEMTT
jgi:hypothetical protein